MKCVWTLVFLIACLSQALMAVPTSPESNQKPANESSLEETPLFSTKDTNQETKQNEETVTSLPSENESEDVETTEAYEEEDDEVQLEEAESKRTARGMELGLGTYGRNMKIHRMGPKSKIIRPRKGYASPKYGPPSPLSHRRSPTKYGPSNYRGYAPENVMIKTPFRPSYEDKVLMKRREKINFQRAPSHQVAVLPPKLVYSGPIPIPFGPSDASYQTPFITEEKRSALPLMFQSLPSYPSKNFRDEPKEPINHANYQEAIIPVTEPSIENIASSTSPSLEVTTSIPVEPYEPLSSTFKFIPNEATSTEIKVASNLQFNDYDNHDSVDIRKPTIDFGLPMNYYYMPSESTRYGGKYKFGFQVTDHESGNDFGHEEEREGDLADGRYHVLLPDGRVQNVNYHADHTGYYADVSYKKGQNEYFRKGQIFNVEKDDHFEKDREQLYAPYQN